LWLWACRSNVGKRRVVTIDRVKTDDDLPTILLRVDAPALQKLIHLSRTHATVTHSLPPCRPSMWTGLFGRFSNCLHFLLLLLKRKKPPAAHRCERRLFDCGRNEKTPAGFPGEVMKDGVHTRIDCDEVRGIYVLRQVPAPADPSPCRHEKTPAGFPGEVTKDGRIDCDEVRGIHWTSSSPYPPGRPLLKDCWSICWSFRGRHSEVGDLQALLE
jgi:hypothetical protein